MIVVSGKNKNECPSKRKLRFRSETKEDARRDSVATSPHLAKETLHRSVVKAIHPALF
jgi:hypothetical protein